MNEDQATVDVGTPLPGRVSELGNPITLAKQTIGLTPGIAGIAGAFSWRQPSEPESLQPPTMRSVMAYPKPQRARALYKRMGDYNGRMADEAAIADIIQRQTEHRNNAAMALERMQAISGEPQSNPGLANNPAPTAGQAIAATLFGIQSGGNFDGGINAIKPLMERDAQREYRKRVLDSESANGNRAQRYEAATQSYKQEMDSLQATEADLSKAHQSAIDRQFTSGENDMKTEAERQAMEAKQEHDFAMADLKFKTEVSLKGLEQSGRIALSQMEHAQASQMLINKHMAQFEAERLVVGDKAARFNMQQRIEADIAKVQEAWAKADEAKARAEMVKPLANSQIQKNAVSSQADMMRAQAAINRGLNDGPKTPKSATKMTVSALRAQKQEVLRQSGVAKNTLVAMGISGDEILKLRSGKLTIDSVAASKSLSSAAMQELKATVQKLQKYDSELSQVDANIAVAKNSFGEQLIDRAAQYEGTSYVWGGESKSGTDCSGLVCKVLSDMGVNIGRTTADGLMRGQVGRSVTNPAPGDVLFFDFEGQGRATHTGIYLGGEYIIHASSKAGRVIKTKMGNMADKIIGVKRFGQ